MKRRAALLWTLLVLFMGRVLGQLLVALGWADFLPPMQEWYSGVIAYPQLLFCPLIIIAVYAKVCLDFTAERGFFVRPRRRLGVGLLATGSVYLVVMIIRYAIQMSL
jgi:hypothetical protein